MKFTYYKQQIDETLMSVKQVLIPDAKDKLERISTEEITDITALLWKFNCPIDAALRLIFEQVLYNTESYSSIEHKCKMNPNRWVEK